MADKSENKKLFSINEVNRITDHYESKLKAKDRIIELAEKALEDCSQLMRRSLGTVSEKNWNIYRVDAINIIRIVEEKVLAEIRKGKV